jgi:hypothetical protein
MRTRRSARDSVDRLDPADDDDGRGEGNVVMHVRDLTGALKSDVSVRPYQLVRLAEQIVDEFPGLLFQGQNDLDELGQADVALHALDLADVHVILSLQQPRECPLRQFRFLTGGADREDDAPLEGRGGKATRHEAPN